VIQDLLVTQWRGKESQRPFSRAVVPLRLTNYRMAFVVLLVFLRKNPDGIRILFSRHVVVFATQRNLAFDLLESSNGAPVKARANVAKIFDICLLYRSGSSDSPCCSSR
jgi:hypothetical protein